MTRGELWWASLPAPWGRRPVLLVARNEAYQALSWVLVAPLTSHIRMISTHVALDPASDGVPRPCAVALDNIQSVHKSWLRDPLGRLSPEKLQAVDRALHLALGLRD